MNKGQQKIQKISYGVIWGLFALIILYLFLISIFGTCVMCYTDEHIYYIKDFAVLLLPGLLFLIAVLGGIGSKIKWNKKQVLIILAGITVVWLAFMLAMIRYLNLQPLYDPGSVYYGANNLLHGNYIDWKPDGYLYIHPYQNGLVLLECPFLFLFGDQAYLIFQYYNLILWGSAILAVSLLAKRFWSRRTASLTYILLLGFIPMWSYVTYVYGTVPGFACAIWSIYMAVRFLDSKKPLWAVGSGVLMALAVMYKTNYEVFALAVILTELFYSLRKRNVKILLGAVMMTVCVITEIKIVPVIIQGITGQSANSGIPFLAWLAMGLKDSSIAPGWYNKTEVLIYQAAGRNVSLMKAECYQSIADSLQLFGKLPAYAVSFFGRKVASLWNLPAFECFTTLTKRNVQGTMPYWVKDLLYNGGIGNTLLTVFLDILQSVVYFGAVLYLLFGWVKEPEERRAEQGIFALVFLGGFVFHLFWEGKCQYTIPYYLMLFPYTARGWEMAAVKWSRFRKQACEGRDGWAIRETARLLAEKCRKTMSGRLLLGLAVLILITGLIPAGCLKSTLKIRGDEREYLYFCTHETEWKDASYHFGS